MPLGASRPMSTQQQQLMPLGVPRPMSTQQQQLMPRGVPRPVLTSQSMSSSHPDQIPSLVPIQNSALVQTNHAHTKPGKIQEIDQLNPLTITNKLILSAVGLLASYGLYNLVFKICS